MILGIDEVGRGAWAGPLVVGAVVLGEAPIDGLTDSKLLSKKRRQEFALLIKEQAAGYGLGWVSASEIDEIGLSAALKLATIRAVSEITASYHQIIIDGTVNFLAETAKGSYVTLLKKADLLIPSVSAASILAKVARDDYMASLDADYPDYHFSSHVGYGTAVHRQAIDTHGPTDLHRYSFSPISSKKTVIPSSSRITTKQIGDKAEQAVATMLKRRGHRLLERNWKNRFCEIDIISMHDDTIYFTEVKYRKSLDQGGGVAAITPAKLRKMKFASELYSTTKKRLSNDRRLAVADVHSDFVVDTWMALD